MNFCSCAYLYISLCIEVILSLFMNSCFSCILSWIICIEFVMSFKVNIHHVFWVSLLSTLNVWFFVPAQHVNSSPVMGDSTRKPRLEPWSTSVDSTAISSSWQVFFFLSSCATKCTWMYRKWRLMAARRGLMMARTRNQEVLNTCVPCHARSSDSICTALCSTLDLATTIECSWPAFQKGPTTSKRRTLRSHRTLHSILDPRRLVSWWTWVWKQISVSREGPCAPWLMLEGREVWFPRAGPPYHTKATNLDL